MKLTVLHNSEAGDGSWTRRRLKDMLREHGHEAHIVASRKGWRDQLDDDCDALVAVGGDGTVHKLIRHVASWGKPVAILPTGTANNVAHAFHPEASKNLPQRVAEWSAHEHVLRLAKVSADGDRTRLLIESVGAGAFAVMREQSKSGAVRSAPGDVLINVRRALARTVRKMKPVPISAEIDGTLHEGEYLLFECMNLPYFGPRLRLANSAQPHRPSLVVVGVRADQRAALAAQIRDQAEHADSYVIARGKRITLRTDDATHVDGKLWPKRGSERLDIRADAGRLRVWV